MSKRKQSAARVRSPQARCWVFTANNPEAQLSPQFWPDCRLCAWQLEIGDDTHTVHWQGYVEFEKVKRRDWIVAHCEGLEEAWIDVRAKNSTKAKAVDYATKQNDVTYLEGPYYWPNEEACRGAGQGKRTDLAGACELVKQGGTNAELAEKFPTTYVKYFRGLNALRNALPIPPAEGNPPKDCVLYWGPSRTGKSHRLKEECPEGPEWFWCVPGKWFDGYEGQEGLVFDEIRDSWYPWEFLLRLIDRGPRRNEVKGDMVRMRATKFRMSSNVHPSQWYQGVKGRPNEPWDESPLRMRFSKIILMDERVDIPPAELAVEDEDCPEPMEIEQPAPGGDYLWNGRQFAEGGREEF